MLLRNPFTGSHRFYGGLWRKVLRERSLFASFILATVLNGLGHGATALAAGLLAKTLATGAPLHGSPWEPNVGAATLAFVGLAATFVKGVGATLVATVQSRLSQKVANVERLGLAERLLCSGTALSSGTVAARFAVQLRELERGVGDGVLGVLRATAQLAPIGLALALLQPRLALGAAAVLGPFAVAVSAARRTWKRSHARAMQLAEGLHQGVDELVAHIDVFRTYGAGANVTETLRRLGEETSRVTSRAEGAQAALSSANEVLGAGALLAVVLAARTWSPSLGSGSLVAFAAVFFMAYRPLRDLGDARGAIQRGTIALEALSKVSSPGTPTALPGTPLGGPSQKRAWTREILLVEMAGGARGPLTSFSVAPGEVVAIVGPTGSGKTTLLRAMLGLEPGARGSIRYGSEELSGAGVGPEARPFAWVPQDAPVVSGTLAENVALADADPGSVARVLAWIGAERLYWTARGDRLGAGGRPVSGGERKWISLARAITPGLPILLLDEPTAGLDERAGAHVLGALERLRATHAVILVTHQPEPLSIADRVVSIGTHDASLLASKLRTAPRTADRFRT
jgi:ABC-type multidrug transport system fused ATPase/permease subunit